MPVIKRIFDVSVVLAMAPLWLPVLLLCALAVAVTEGFPVLYTSKRRTSPERLGRVYKFRTMVKNADRVANRQTVPVSNTRFLNIPPDSPLYTPVGRFIERLTLTELPQLFHVLQGSMSLVGNRPLPDDVTAALAERYPDAPERFLVTGMTGPVQLVGRDNLSDVERLELEISYCRLATRAYSPRLDVTLLACTVLVAVGVMRPFTLDEVQELMFRCVGLPSRSLN